MLRMPWLVLLLMATIVSPIATAQEIVLPPQLTPLQEVLDPTPAPSPSSGGAGQSSYTSDSSTTAGSAEPAPQVTPEATPDEEPPVSVDRGTERRLAALINDERRTRDRTPLTFFGRLARIARGHSVKMAEEGRIFHGLTRTARRIRSWDWVTLGENVGVGASADSLHRAFMNSPRHRKNILRREFRRVAVGMTAARGRMWVTVIFYR